MDPDLNQPTAPDETPADLISVEGPAGKMRDVYVLGAGFSRALHRQMPLVSELSQVVSGFSTSYPSSLTTSGLDSVIGKLILRNFEEALSYLAQDKPWLDDSDNKKDEVRLLELTRNIRFAIARYQSEARRAIMSGECDWINPLIAHWHANRSTVITLNYDTLVEEIVEKMGTAAAKHSIPNPSSPGAFRAHPLASLRVCNILPKTLRDAWLGSNQGGLSQYFYNQPSFQLLKLHGSVNWVRSMNSGAHSDTISYIAASEVPIDSSNRLPQHVADKTPYIVPPVPNKASLVKHDTLRSMWRDAADAIKRANRIVVIGYSMPANDTLLIQLIRGNLFCNNPEIELVNSDDSLHERVRNMFAGETSPIAQRFSGHDAVLHFVQAMPSACG